MKKLLAVTTLLLAANAAHAGKLTYSRADLEAADANSVAGIVERYHADTGRTGLINPAKVLFLLDGRRVDNASEHLPHADRVEVLTSGDSIVVNVVTRPVKRNR